MEQEGVFVLDEQEEEATPSPQTNTTPGCSNPRNGQSQRTAEKRRVGPLDGTPAGQVSSERQASTSEVTAEDEATAALSPHPPSSSVGGTPPTDTPPHEANENISLERRVVPLLEYSEDICSVCLEDYTSQDPGAPTVCGHHYHLQCIMQWAQRSHECPLCFKMLQLEDEDMNLLLPFGEYISPEQRAAESSSLETWELERLLIRLAAGSQREHRYQRSTRHSSSSASRHRRQGSRGEASAPQPIRDATAVDSRAAVASAATLPWLLPGEHAGDGNAAAAAAGARHASAPDPAAYPSSWPPAMGPEPSSSGASASGSMHDDGHVVSPRSRSGSMSFKSRLASLKLKDKFEGVGRELKSLFSPGSSSSHGRGGSAPGRSTSTR